MIDWQAVLLPLGVLVLGTVLLAGAIGRRLGSHGGVHLGPAWLAARIMAGLLAWAALESTLMFVLDGLPAMTGEAWPWLRAALEVFILAAACGIAAILTGAPAVRETGNSPPSGVRGRRIHGSTANDPFGSIREEPWEAATAGMGFGGFVAGLAMGLLSALAFLMPLAAIDPWALLVRGLDILNLAAAAALGGWAIWRLATGHPGGLAGGLTGAWLLRGCFRWMLQAEFPWPLLALALGAMGLLVAWRYLGDVRLEYREKPPKKKRKRTGCSDC